jgi:hypothetical protein
VTAIVLSALPLRRGCGREHLTLAATATEEDIEQESPENQRRPRQAVDGAGPAALANAIQQSRDKFDAWVERLSVESEKPKGFTPKDSFESK